MSYIYLVSPFSPHNSKHLCLARSQVTQVMLGIIYVHGRQGEQLPRPSTRTYRRNYEILRTWDENWATYVQFGCPEPEKCM